MRRILLLAASAHALTTSSRRRFGLGAASAASAAALAPAQPAAAVREGSTKSGLRYRVEVEGSGDTPKRGQNAMIDYVLRVGVDGKPPLYVDGTKQYGLQARPLQFTLGVGAQIPGFDEAVLDMRVGETRTVIVPPKLGCASTASSIPRRQLYAIDATPPRRWRERHRGLRRQDPEGCDADLYVGVEVALALRAHGRAAEVDRREPESLGKIKFVGIQWHAVRRRGSTTFHRTRSRPRSASSAAGHGRVRRS